MRNARGRTGTVIRSAARRLAAIARDPFGVIGPIRIQLTAYVAAFLAIVVALGCLSVARLVSDQADVAALEGKWLVSSGLLGELGRQVAQFRLAEAYRGLDHGRDARAAAERFGSKRRQAVERIEKSYRALMGPDADRIDLDAFERSWGAYLAAHDEWMVADVVGQIDDPARLSGRAHQLYQRADADIQQLIRANAAATHAVVVSAARRARAGVAAIVLTAALAVLLAAFVFFRVRSMLIRPLGDITTSLVRLAAGEHEVAMPEMHRSDEIGQMAAAFDVFRRDALALEDARRLAESLAHQDTLTGLLNRRGLWAGLASGKHGSGATERAVLIIDLDRFKEVNDFQGHQVGDRVLQEVASRLKAVIGGNGAVGRLGGDEFAIVAETADRHELAILARRILATVRAPIHVEGERIHISASVGVAICAGGTMEDVFRAADLAMYGAKRDGRADFRFFEAGMDVELRARAAFNTDLRRAIADGQILPWYQPLVDLPSGKIWGFEALARWEHPQRGIVGPDSFIHQAEELGLISDLTKSMLRRVCRDARHWPGDISIAVNISPRQLRDAALPAQIVTILNQEDFPPSRLEIEVTETALATDIETARDVLVALRSIGVRVALDDFGTGYSSLFHLSELRFDRLKIDRSFVRSMARNPESVRLVDGIVRLASSIGLTTLAEGIEDENTMRDLLERGCQLGQGYLFGKPMPAAEAGALLGAGSAGIRAGARRSGA